MTQLTQPLRYLALTAIALLNVYSSLAQHRINGTVQDEQQQPLPSANVLLLSATDSSLVKGTVADTTGVYALEAVEDGNYVLSVQMIGYKSYFSDPFSPQTATQQRPPVQLAESTTELGEVVVQAAKPLMEVTSNALVMNVSASPILQNGSAKEVLEKSPGVVVDQNGNISVKGKSNVLVYLDGKPTYMSTSDLLQMLESMPAQNIEKVEIMDNPPAKYDAEGNAGIINIVRTAEAATGLNGTIGVNAGYGLNPKLSPSLQLNYRQEKFNLFGDASYFYNKYSSSTDLFRRIPTATGGITTFDQRTEDLGVPQGLNFRAGADWFITKQSTIGILISGNDGRYNETSNNRTLLGGDYDNPYDGLDAINVRDNDWQSLTYNVNFEQNWKEAGTLKLDLDYVQRNSSSDQRNDNYYFSNEGTTDEPPLLVRTYTNTQIDILAAQADYSLSIGEAWQLEAGGKISRVTTDNNLDFNTLDEGGESVLDTLRSNRFMYDENIDAGYADLTKKWGDRWVVRAGLRGEHTFSRGESVTLDSIVQRDYFNVFPSASASYTIPNEHSFSLSYSRRIDRPDYGNLNPFEYFLDRFTFSRGNPFLNPQYTDAYALTYGLKNAVFVTLNYNLTKDAITQVLQQENEIQTTFQTSVNLNQIKNYSVNLSAPVPVTQWWTANVNLTSFYNHIESPFSEGGTIDNSQFSFTANAQNTFTLPKDIKLELSGYYNSPMLYGMFEISEQYQMDLGVTKTFGRLRVQATLNDVFNWQGNRVVIRQGDVDAVVVNDWESQVFRLNLSFRFGNDNIKKARQRGTASEDLQQRAGE